MDRFAAFAEAARRGPALALVAALTAGAAGCTSGSAHHASGAAGSPSSSASASPSDSPVINAGDQGVDALTGTATVTLSGTRTAVKLATDAGSTAQLSVDASHQIRTEFVMHGKGGALFSLGGPAAVGEVTGDKVTLFLPSAGILLDTTQGNACTVTFSKAAESGLAVTASCDAENGSARYTVRIAFTLR